MENKKKIGIWMDYSTAELIDLNHQMDKKSIESVSYTHLDVYKRQGADFEEENLNVKGVKFNDASIFYNETSQINIEEIKRWLEKSKTIQWDYKNIVKRKGKLERIT